MHSLDEDAPTLLLMGQSESVYQRITIKKSLCHVAFVQNSHKIGIAPLMSYKQMKLIYAAWRRVQCNLKNDVQC